MTISGMRSGRHQAADRGNPELRLVRRRGADRAQHRVDMRHARPWTGRALTDRFRQPLLKRCERFRDPREHLRAERRHLHRIEVERRLALSEDEVTGTVVGTRDALGGIGLEIDEVA